MDLNFSADEVAFREDVRAFLRDNLPDDIRGRIRNGDHGHIRDDLVRWQKILYRRGWGAPGWPVEFGGTGWSKTRQYIFETECALADAPPQLAFGLKMVGPVIMRFGSPVQQRCFLPRIVAGEDWWCQGYSEPGAGSDLASLKMRAECDGDHYIVNGQKVWNSLGQFADWIFCLVRTDPGVKPQRGISFLLIDMKTPGIRVRPTRLLDGSFEVNEVWFDNVRVPVADRVGEENAGWNCAKFLLGHERTNLADIGASRDPAARGHGHDRRVRRQSLLQAPSGIRAAFRHHRPAPRALPEAITGRLSGPAPGAGGRGAGATAACIPGGRRGARGFEIGVSEGKRLNGVATAVAPGNEFVDGQGPAQFRYQKTDGAPCATLRAPAFCCLAAKYRFFLLISAHCAGLYAILTEWRSMVRSHSRRPRIRCGAASS